MSMKIFSILPFLLICQIGFAQRTTFSVGLNSGISRFSGASAHGTTSLTIGGSFCHCESQAASSLGNLPAATVGASAIVQREFKSHFVVSLEAGYEILRTRIKVDQYQLDDMIVKTDGVNITRHQFVNAFPSAGYNFRLNETLNLTVTGGIDLGFGLKSSSRTTIPDFSENLYTDQDNLVQKVDHRARIQAKLDGKRLGFTASYAHGTRNWLNGWAGGPTDLHMRVWRVGVQYRIF